MTSYIDHKSYDQELTHPDDVVHEVHYVIRMTKGNILSPPDDILLWL